MANDTQDESSRNSIVGRSVISPPPPYTTLDLKNDRRYYHHQTVNDTVLKMQEVIESTYLMMQDLQNRLARLESSSHLFPTDPAPWVYNKRANPLRDETHSTDHHDDYTDILDTMTYTVQQLLKDAQASLDRTIILPSTTDTTPTETIMSFDYQSRYLASERKLDRTFELLMDQVCNTNFNGNDATLVPETGISPNGNGVNLDFHYHHHHHHHYYHNDYTPTSTPSPQNATIHSATMTSMVPAEPSSSDITNSMLSTATTKSVQLVQNWLSPLHRFTAPMNRLPISPEPALALSPTTSTTTTTTSSIQMWKDNQQRRYWIRIHRTIWVLLVTSRLLLEQHYRPPSSFLSSNSHLLQPRHRHLWHKYKSILLGCGSSLPALCRRMSRFIFIIQFIYHLLSI